MASPSDPSQHVWLHGQLDAWVADGIITADTAGQLRSRHPVTEGPRSHSGHWIMVLFGIIGAVLIGGGIILLLAHNWEQMGRPARVAVAFTPLVLSQALAFWMLWAGKGGTWGREAVGTFIALMAGACIALISQTYHLGGDFAEFMLVWTLLSLPVAYLLRATLPAIWFCAATVIWACNLDWNHKGSEVWFWPLLSLVLPLWWMEVRRDRYHPRAVLLAWAIAGAGCIGVVICCDSAWKADHWMLASGGWYAFLYLVGRRWFAAGRTLWHRPLQFIGVVGAAVIALMLTFDWAWRNSSYDSSVLRVWDHPAAWLGAFVWAALAVVLWIESLVRRDFAAAVVGALPVLIVVAIALPDDGFGLAHALFNAYVFATGVTLLVVGVRAQQLGTVNGGMAMISALVLCRFFDSDMGFILRGVVFIVLGIAFITTNFILLRRKGSAS